MAVHHASTSHLLEHLRADAIDFFFVRQPVLHTPAS